MGCVPSKGNPAVAVGDGDEPQKSPEPAPRQPDPVPQPAVNAHAQPPSAGSGGAAPAAAAAAAKNSVPDEKPAAIEARSFESRYKVKNSLGKGRYGTVKVCVEIATQKEYAVKIINGKSLKNPSIIDEEVFKLKRVGAHPNVVAFHDFFKDDHTGMFYIVMELCKGGDLFSRIVEDGSYNEKTAAQLLRQLANALVYIHSLGITHRDLKPENILLSSKGPDAVVKIVDFGLSKMVKEDQALMTTVIGTWAYCAPEVFSQTPYDNSVDTWALGILMFIMLSGYHPFDPYGELSDGELITRITNDDFNFDEPEWDGISDEAKFIIKKLLQKDPTKRMSLQLFLNTPWVTGEVAGNTDLSSSIKRMQSFSTKFRPAGQMASKLEAINDQKEQDDFKGGDDIDDEEPGVVHIKT